MIGPAASLGLCRTVATGMKGALRRTPFGRCEAEVREARGFLKKPKLRDVLNTVSVTKLVVGGKTRLNAYYEYLKWSGHC